MAVAANGLDEAKCVAEHLHVVKSIARRYATLGIPLKDLEQEGAIGLLMAVRKWDSSRGASLSTYSTKYITKYIKRAIGESEDGEMTYSNISISKHVKRPEEETEGAHQGIDVSMDEARAESSSTLHDVLPSSAKTPEQLYIEAEQKHALHAAIRTLSPEERQVLDLRLKSCSYVEIAAALPGCCSRQYNKIEARAIRVLAGRLAAS